MSDATVIAFEPRRKAAAARQALLQLLHSPAWLLGVDVVVEDGAPALHVRVTRATGEARACTPSAVDDVPVFLRPMTGEVTRPAAEAHAGAVPEPREDQPE